MKNKFKYVDLVIAGTVGAIIALAVHHEWRKSRAKAFISNIQKNDKTEDNWWETPDTTDTIDDLWDDIDPEEVIDMNAMNQENKNPASASSDDTDAGNQKEGKTQ